MTPEIRDALTRAFADLFAQGVYYFSKDHRGGGPGYFGIAIENVAPDGSELDLGLTFLAGKCYCCYEPACHFAYYEPRGWILLRECMDRVDSKGFRCRPSADSEA